MEDRKVPRMLDGNHTEIAVSSTGRVRISASTDREGVKRLIEVLKELDDVISWLKE